MKGYTKGMGNRGLKLLMMGLLFALGVPTLLAQVCGANVVEMDPMEGISFLCEAEASLTVAAVVVRQNALAPWAEVDEVFSNTLSPPVVQYFFVELGVPFHSESFFLRQPEPPEIQ